MTRHDRYKEEFSKWWMNYDQKPTKNERRLLHRKARAWTRQKVQDELNFSRDGSDTYDMTQEILEATYCHLYGPCNKCRETKDEDSI